MSDRRAIWILTETFHPEVGGGETQARALAEGLAGRGYLVEVITRRSASETKRIDRLGPVRIRRVPPVGAGQLKKWGLLLTMLLPLLRVRERPRTLFVSGFRILGIPAVLTGMALGTPCVLKADSLGEMSGAFFERGLQQLGLSTRSWPFRAFLALRNRLLRQGSRFVSISRPVETELLEAGVEPAAIARIPNGVDVDRFRPADLDEKQRLRERFGIPPGASAVIFTGRLVVYKGLAGLLRAWGAIRQRHPDALLLIVGSGGLDLDNCEQELKDQARDDELGDSVRFVGAVERVEDYLRAADIFVFPTEEEAFGISLVEAMACELPVVSTPAGGLAEILARSDFGLTVEAGSDAALGDALDALLRDPETRARLGREGRRIAERDYSLGAVVDRYVDLFESAPDPGGPHRALPSDGLGGSTR